MLYFPNAKINLGLEVLRKREDGFHDLSTSFYAIPWRDVLEIIPSEKDSFDSSGINIPSDGSPNLCQKAVSLLRRDYDFPPLKMHLHKVIPIGGGLGGGSSDASFTLKAINEQFSLGISEQKLIDYSLELGSDCPFFIKNRAVIAGGRGEVMKEISLDLQGYYLLLLNPRIHVSTKDAFSRVVPNSERKSIEEILLSDIREWKELLVNDFEESVFSIYPKIQALKELLYSRGAVYAAMSGTGSTVYGIFKEEIEMSEWEGQYFDVFSCCL